MLVIPHHYIHIRVLHRCDASGPKVLLLKPFIMFDCWLAVSRGCWPRFVASESTYFLVDPETLYEPLVAWCTLVIGVPLFGGLIIHVCTACMYVCKLSMYVCMHA